MKLEGRTCNYSCKYGGNWVDGIFHRWVDVSKTDFLTGTNVMGLIENKRTGHMELVSPAQIVFYDEEDADEVGNTDSI